MRGEALGICQTFDERTTKWVKEMGFGGLLHLPSDLQLPRKLNYWLLSRVDPISQKLIGSDGKEFKFSNNQVHRVLGIPNGGLPVPTKKSLSTEMRAKTYEILGKYGKTWEGKSRNFLGRTYTSTGIPINSSMMDRLEDYWEAHDKEEFKTLFLLIILQMLLCPTQSPRLAADLVPALTCASDCQNFDWCELVMGRLMQSVVSFARAFYASGFAKGCGGCTIFLVIFYLDRLNRDPVSWGSFPRIKVWNMQHIRGAAKEDKITATGDFGHLGMLDVAYGEQHLDMARDSNGPVDTARL
ncbi:uncharacterized protein LOC110720637 isoform X2 [Chenopodium quinoa]|uniref:uncharacterized protein LOC110720637 isoform X2 n=1 Tax=Chenopodium quinoa TaxID=63459 RepID=UPI000B771F5E|nr:uncharacterized protein LOC110720637 isoform X2 [Chenopodium quinoa]